MYCGGAQGKFAQLAKQFYVCGVLKLSGGVVAQIKTFALRRRSLARLNAAQLVSSRVLQLHWPLPAPAPLMLIVDRVALRPT